MNTKYTITGFIALGLGIIFYTNYINKEARQNQNLNTVSDTVETVKAQGAALAVVQVPDLSDRAKQGKLFSLDADFETDYQYAEVLMCCACVCLSVVVWRACVSFCCCARRRMVNDGHQVEDLQEGTFLAKITDMSLDPYIRGTMNPVSYGRQQPYPRLMTCGAVAQVVLSRHPAFEVGAPVNGQVCHFL